MPQKIKLLTVTEAAEMLGVNPETLRRWDRSGRLVAIKMGERGDRRYDVKEIEKLVRKKQI